MKSVLVGNGFIGASHRAAYKTLKEENSDIVLQAICDIRPEKLQENDGVKTYTDLDEMLDNEKNIDFVDLCVPTFLHAELSIHCMERGFNVLCEKPMALTEEECDRMMECAQRTGKKLMIGQCCRFAADMQIARRFIMDQKFGKPISAFFTSTGARPYWGWNDWFLDKNLSGGCMLDLQAHNIDLINWYFGLPDKVSAVATERFEGEGFVSVSANHIYGDGLYVHSWSDWEIPRNNYLFRSMRINFEKGYLFNERGARHVLVAVDNDGNETDLTDTIKLAPSTIRNEIEYFANAIKTNQPVRMNLPKESKKVIRIMRAQEQSALNNGMPVDVSED